ncbi:uncharacterized protein FIBRA_09255 [Fibroporia radiculosa]|uniref:Uncharacterized protein n=1 Tax=Fibroporia radiculosa TaxID=599839 RepID=J7SC74_9APHY|nr:uncharacterized protein FIBRA_09255 [Fibroporia radiculosa]CCM06941.1 predicted protein [Fibroporia radiculosa]
MSTSSTPIPMAGVEPDLSWYLLNPQIDEHVIARYYPRENNEVTRVAWKEILESTTQSLQLEIQRVFKDVFTQTGQLEQRLSDQQSEITAANVRLAAVENANVQLRTDYTVLVEQLNQHVAQVAQQPATSMSHEQEERRFRIVQPGRFANNSKEQTFEQFVEKLAVWYTHQKVTSDRDQITGVLALLEGRAHVVAGNYYCMVKDAKDLGKYEDFLHQMRRAFTMMDQEEDARQEFLKMLRKYDKVSAADTAKFIGEFRGLADLMKSTDNELIAAI